MSRLIYWDVARGVVITATADADVVAIANIKPKKYMYLFIWLYHRKFHESKQAHFFDKYLHFEKMLL